MKHKIYTSLLLFFAAFVAIKAQTIDSLLVWSVNNHPALKAAYLDYEAALEKVHGTGFLPEPVLSVGYFITAPETRLGPQIGSVGLQQMFPWRGTLKAQKNIAVSAAKIKYERFNLLKEALFKEIKQLSYQAENNQVGAKLLKQNIDLLEQVKAIGLSKISSGSASATDILRLNLQIEALKTKINTVQIQLHGKIEALSLLTGKSIDTIYFESQSLPDSIQSTQLIQTHPMIAMSQQKLETNAAERKIIAQKVLPTFGLGVNYIAVAERTDMDPDGNGRDVLMPKLTMTLPIYRGKYKRLNKMNALQKESIEEEVKAVELDLQTKLVQVQTKIKSAEERITLFQKQTQTAKSILSMLQSDYKHNSTSIESVLSTNMQLLDYQIETANAQRDLKIAYSELAFLLNK